MSNCEFVTGDKCARIQLFIIISVDVGISTEPCLWYQLPQVARVWWHPGNILPFLFNGVAESTSTKLHDICLSTLWLHGMSCM